MAAAPPRRCMPGVADVMARGTLPLVFRDSFPFSLSARYSAARLAETHSGVSARWSCSTASELSAAPEAAAPLLQRRLVLTLCSVSALLGSRRAKSSSLLTSSRSCWRMGCMGRVAHRSQQIACISVQEARRASTLQHRRMQCGGCGGGGRMACLFSLSRLVCDRIVLCICFVPDVYVVNACTVGWATAAITGGNARGVKHVCTGSPRRAAVLWYGVRAVLPRLWNTVHGLHYILAVPCRGGSGSMAVGAVAVWYGRKTVFQSAPSVILGHV